MDPVTEIRKVDIGHIYGLIQILEGADSWKKLMSCIPKELESKNFKPKYTNEDMKLIESESIKQKRPCTAILFDEWGTSGRTRPTLTTLRNILVQAELFRAADYVSDKLLKISLPKRPDTGPAARVEVSLPHILAKKELDKINVESVLENISYPNLTTDIPQTYNKNLDHKLSPDKNSDHRNNFLTLASASSNNSANSVTLSSVSTKSTNVSSDANNDTNMTGDSDSNNVTDSFKESIDIPAISMLLKSGAINSEEPSEIHSQNGNSEIIFNSVDNGHTSNSSNTNLEAVNMNISNASLSSSELNIPDFNMLQSIKQNIPNISFLQDASKPETYLSSGSYIPELSALLNDNSKNTNNDSLPITSSSLNTILPHFSYDELQKATNNFVESFEENQSSAKKIGDGGFGTVYLTSGLLNHPVAVKKLKLFGPAGHNREPIISKQFKTEVEILSKYSHSNILTLLGYSCDGPSYCMVYEYIDGGSLRENISRNSNLPSLVRHNIALETALAIEFLHYGFSTPLIHRDIKSANILLTKSNIPKLCDFGLVKLLPNQTVTSNVMGTTAYMAPEAFRGDVSVKMDVFSFGVVLLELLTGLPPMDDTRPGTDIVTHVDDMCSDGFIQPLLDKNAGIWESAENLFSLARHCFEDKRKRPLITDVVKRLKEFI